jgi:23S rRNA pseudouridine1911/1915/1917 synthase
MVEDVEIPRVMLHARTLGFHHPSTGEFQEYTKPLPSDMEQVVQALDGLMLLQGARKS